MIPATGDSLEPGQSKQEGGTSRAGIRCGGGGRRKVSAGWSGIPRTKSEALGKWFILRA